MWQSVTIPLNGSGAGNASILTKANLPFGNEGQTALLLKVYIPAQPGFVSGATDVVISEVMPDSLLNTIATLTNPTTPVTKPLKSLDYDSTGTVTTNYDFQGVSSVNVAIAQGNANATVTVWLQFLN